MGVCVCVNVYMHTLIGFLKNQGEAQIGIFASIMTFPVAVIVPLTVAIESHLLISPLPSEYPCFLKPVMFVALKTNDSVTIM